jgi:hypothetical protein
VSGRAPVSLVAVVMIAVVGCTAQLGGPSSKAAADPRPSAPDACTLLSVKQASHLLGSPASAQAFTDLGFPVSGHGARNPAYSQCRFTARSARRQIRLTINSVLAKAPPLKVEALAARGQPGSRILRIDGALTVWRPWTQRDLRRQGGVLSSVKDGDYVEVALVYVHRGPLGVAEGVLRVVLPKIPASSR